MDYLTIGRTMKHYIYPPSFPTEEDLKIFDKDLVPSIAKKLQQLNTISRKLASDTSVQDLAQKLGIDIVSEERTVINKWQRYWLEILDQHEGKKTRQHLGISIPRAKEFPLEQLYQGELRQNYGKLSGLCPFHKERTPSFYIYPDNKYHCFGCNEHGDSIDYVMRIKNMDFVEAAKWLTI